MSEEEGITVSRYDPARATAQYVRAIALTLFSMLVGGAGLAVYTSTAGRYSSPTWALWVGGIGSLVLLLMAVANYFQGNDSLKR